MFAGVLCSQTETTPQLRETAQAHVAPVPHSDLDRYGSAGIVATTEAPLFTTYAKVSPDNSEWMCTAIYDAECAVCRTYAASVDRAVCFSEALERYAECLRNYS